MKQTAALSLGTLGLNESFVQLNEIMGYEKCLKYLLQLGQINLKFHYQSLQDKPQIMGFILSQKVIRFLERWQR